MATSELVKHLKDVGSRLVKELDKQGMKVRTAFWMYDEDTHEWRLVLSMPIVDEKGATAAQKQIAMALEKAGIKNLYLRQVQPRSPKDRLVSSISSTVRTKGGESIHLNRSALGGEWIEDVFVYRST